MKRAATFKKIQYAQSMMAASIQQTTKAIDAVGLINACFPEGREAASWYPIWVKVRANGAYQENQSDPLPQYTFVRE